MKNLLHLDIQPFFESNFLNNLKVLCGKDYSVVRKAQKNMFLKYPEDKICPKCKALYEANKKIIDDNYILGRNTEFAKIDDLAEDIPE